MNTLEGRLFLRFLALGCGYYLFLALAFAAGVRTGIISIPATFNPAAYFDAAHYEEISRNGYAAFHSHAFFPLFPALWKFSHLGAWGISLLNGIIFLLTCAWVAFMRRVTPGEFLLYLALPGTLFFFMPYSESVFFLSSALFLNGLSRGNRWMRLSGLLLCGLARPAFSVFIPAIIAVKILCSGRYPLREMILDLILALAAFPLTLLLMDSWSGEWWLFFEAQQKGWGNELQWPEFPFRTWSNLPILILDLISLAIGLIACFVLGRWLWIKLFTQKPLKIPAPEVVFSLAYIAGISLLVLFFRGGELFSLNRFVLSTAFFALVCWEWRMSIISTRFVWIGFCFIALLLAVHGMFVHLRVVLLFMLALGTIALLGIRPWQEKRRKWMQALALVVLTLLQLYFAWRMVTGDWIA